MAPSSRKRGHPILDTSRLVPDFTRSFANTTDGIVEYEGRMLRASYRVSVVPQTRLRITFQKCVRRPVQGLSIKLEDPRGALEIEGTRSRGFALWTDTAPHDVECVVLKARRNCQLSLHNTWRDEKYGTMMYHLNAAAMDVREQPDGSLLMCCSDGWGTEPSFEDLVVRLAIDLPSGAGRP